MDLKCQHISFNVSDIEAMKDFYVNTLGMELLDDKPNFFAARAGDVRFSFFGGANKRNNFDDNEVGTGFVLRTDNIEKIRDELVKKGVPMLNDIVTAPGFMKFITIEDPDNNIIHIGEYLADPLEKKI
jgi:catechol 2,3-dioxygenase-like lactoylglutathione lyase family enzyme